MCFLVMPEFLGALTIRGTFMQDVDGRDKPGHDSSMPNFGFKLVSRSSDFDLRHFHNQIGKPFGGVEPADGARGGRHSRKARGVRCE